MQKFAKRAVAAIVAMAMVLAFMPITVQANPNVIYDLRTDGFIQGLQVGHQIYNSPNMFNAYTAFSIAGADAGTTITVQANNAAWGGNRALQVTERGGTDWRTLDFMVMRDNFGLSATGTYTVRVRATMPGGAGFWLGDTDSPWRSPRAEASHVPELGQGMFEATWTFSPGADIGDRRGIRITAGAATESIMIYEIVLVRGSSIPANLPTALTDRFTPPAAPPPPPPPPPPPTPPTPPAGPNVVASTQPVSINGTVTPVGAFNIGGSNFFQLRDLAYALRNTPARFNVGFVDGAVTLTTGTAYVVQAGRAYLAPVGNPVNPVPGTQAVRVNGAASNLQNYAWNIGGSNFFQLRALGDALGFEVGFVDGVVTITTN